MEILDLAEVGRRIGRKPATIRSWTKPGMERFRADLLVKRHAGGRYYSTPETVTAWLEEIDRATKAREIVWRKTGAPADTRTLPLFPDDELETPEAG